MHRVPSTGCRPARRRCTPPRARDERGAAALEFALLLPVLLVLVFGIVQYGLYFWAMQGGSDIARDAARMSAVGTPGDCATFRTAVQRQVEALTGRGETVTVRRTYADAAPTGINVGDTVEVAVSFRSIDLQLPFLPFVDEGLVESVVQARVEFVPSVPEACVA